MNYELANGGTFVVQIRNAGNTQTLFMVRPGDTQHFPLADGTYTVRFLLASTGAVQTTPAPFQIVTGNGGRTGLYVFNNNTTSNWNYRDGNAYTLAGYTLPSYVQTDESFAWFAGFTLGVTVRLVHAARRWFSRVSREDF